MEFGRDVQIVMKKWKKEWSGVAVENEHVEMRVESKYGEGCQNHALMLTVCYINCSEMKVFRKQYYYFQR